jgi:hypothetical protein
MVKRIRSQSPAPPACHASKTKRAAPHLTSLHLTSLLPCPAMHLCLSPYSEAAQSRAVALHDNSNLTQTSSRMRIRVRVAHTRPPCPRPRGPSARVTFISAANIHLRPCLPGPCAVSLTTSRQAAFHERDLPLDTMRPSMPYACSAHCITIQRLCISPTWYPIDVMLVTTFSAGTNSA